MDVGRATCEARRMRITRIRAIYMTSFLYLITGCGHASSIASAVIDCTRADNAAKIDAVEAELKLLAGWDGRYARATAAGAVIGGCALLRLLEHGGASSSSSVLPDQGWLTFERFRREQAGGASFQTRGGVK